MALIHLVDDDLAVTDASRFLLEGLDYRVKILERQPNLYRPSRPLPMRRRNAGYSHAGDSMGSKSISGYASVKVRWQ